jgi:acetylornithine/succinyldiaminopimelate/putrescine aminotransferase
MTADIAHELRTPISIILGHAEAVHDGVLPATSEVFEIIRDENLLDNVQRQGAYLRQRLLELKQETPMIAEVRGAGLMIGLELAQNGADLVAWCLDHGLHVNCTHDTVLRIMPPLNITREVLDEALAILADGLRAMRP